MWVTEGPSLWENQWEQWLQISADRKFPESLGYANAVGPVTERQEYAAGQAWPATTTPLCTSE